MNEENTKILHQKYPDLLTKNGESLLRGGEFEYDDGWFTITDDFLCLVNNFYQETKKHYPEIFVDADFIIFKQKLGSFRVQGFRFGGVPEVYNDILWIIISNLESISMYTCEITGERGKLRTDLYFIQTLCDEEYEERAKKGKRPRNLIKKN